MCIKTSLLTTLNSQIQLKVPVSQEEIFWKRQCGKDFALDQNTLMSNSVFSMFSGIFFAFNFEVFIKKKRKSIIQISFQ